MATSSQKKKRHQASAEAGGLSIGIVLPSWAGEYLKLLAEMERCGLRVDMPAVLADILKETEIEITV